MWQKTTKHSSRKLESLQWSRKYCGSNPKLVLPFHPPTQAFHTAESWPSCNCWSFQQPCHLATLTQRRAVSSCYTSLGFQLYNGNLKSVSSGDVWNKLPSLPFSYIWWFIAQVYLGGKDSAKSFRELQSIPFICGIIPFPYTFHSLSPPQQCEYLAEFWKQQRGEVLLYSLLLKFKSWCCSFKTFFM